MAAIEGMEGARGALAARLASQLSIEATALEAQLGLDPGDLAHLVPNLISVAERSRIEPDEFPAVLIVGQTTRSRGSQGYKRTFDPNTQAVEITREYRLRVYSTVRAEGYEETSIDRDRLSRMVWLALIRRPGVIAENARINVEDWQESFSAVSARDGRTMAGSYLEVGVITNEAVRVDPTAPEPPSATTIGVIDDTIEGGS